MPTDWQESLERDLARLEERFERRLNEMAKEMADHHALPGHSSHTDLLARINRLELGIGSTLVAVVILLVKAFLPGAHG